MSKKVLVVGASENPRKVRFKFTRKTLLGYKIR